MAAVWASAVEYGRRGVLGEERDAPVDKGPWKLQGQHVPVAPLVPLVTAQYACVLMAWAPPAGMRNSPTALVAPSSLEWSMTPGPL